MEFKSTKETQKPRERDGVLRQLCIKKFKSTGKTRKPHERVAIEYPSMLSTVTILT
jgi:hypothetical protein